MFATPNSTKKRKSCGNTKKTQMQTPNRKNKVVTWTHYINSLGTPNNKAICNLQTFVGIFGSIASFAWITIITVVLYKLLLFQNKWDESVINKMKQRFHIVWVFAFICAIIPTATSTTHKDKGWCFIDDSTIGIVFRFFFYYLWVVFAIVIIAVVFIKIYKYLKTLDNSQNLITNNPTIQCLKYYPIGVVYRQYDNVTQCDIMLFGLKYKTISSCSTQT